MRRLDERSDSDQGAILVHVAFAILALMAFSTFAIDYGVFWESRRQAQNSADAAALAGAEGLITQRDFTDTGPAKVSAFGVSQVNLIWGAPPSVVKATDITFSGESHGSECPNALAPGADCITVDVYRSVARGNALPMFFGSLVGLTQQDVRATATATVVPANASDCVAPVAILDKSPSYTLAADLGTPITLKDDQSWPGQSGFHGFLTFGGTGASSVGEAIRECKSGIHYVGEDITSWQKPGNTGGVKKWVDDLIALENGYSPTWDQTSKSIVGSCAAAGACSKYLNGNVVPDPGAAISPRVLALPIVDLAVWNASQTLVISNFLGFFVTGTSGNGNKDIDGILVQEPGLLYGGGGPVDPGSGFVKTVVLIR